MKTYPRLRNILFVFSAEASLSEPDARAIYQRALSADPALAEEIRQAFDDTDLDWREMLCNEEYEIQEAENNAEALEYAKRLLL